MHLFVIQIFNQQIKKVLEMLYLDFGNEQFVAVTEMESGSFQNCEIMVSTIIFLSL